MGMRITDMEVVGWNLEAAVGESAFSLIRQLDNPTPTSRDPKPQRQLPKDLEDSERVHIVTQRPIASFNQLAIGNNIGLCTSDISA